MPNSYDPNILPLDLSDQRKSELDCFSNVTSCLIEEVLRAMDELCCYVRSGCAFENERKLTYALKNMLLTTLWEKRPDLFVGVWDHTSSLRSTRLRILTVFAIQVGEYKTTWHFPKEIVRSLIGQVPLSHDLIASGDWENIPSVKESFRYNHYEVELKRSFVAWFLLTFKKE